MEDQVAIRWRSWGVDAFQQAHREGKPIFLSISAAWCHWCHVLDEESFTHPEVIRRINADFVPIRVDSDKRPDINSRYNMGGWPTVAILDPQGDLVTGGTYMPTGQLLSMLAAPMQGPSFSPTPPEAGRGSLSSLRAPEVDESIIQTVAGFLERVFDRNFGGFGGPPKFPQVWAIDLAFHLHPRTGEKKWLEMATLTLDHMREGELYDLIDGGFFRYSTSDDWDSPHYEKLLEVNAHLLSLYLRAYLLTGQITYRATAQGILDYLFSTLAAEGQSWFFGSQSADQDYYTSSEEKRLWADSPPLDRTIYTDRNAMTVSALLLAYPVLGEVQYREKALGLIDFLWDHFHQSGQGMLHYDDGKLYLPGYLSDQVHMTLALMDAFEATGVRLYLDRAEELALEMERDLWDCDYGAYWDLPESSESLGALKFRMKPFTENSVASITLTRLFHLTGREVYRNRSQAVLAYLSTVFAPYKHHAAPFALALERFCSLPYRVAVVGHPADARWGELLRAAHLLKSPWKVVLPLDAKRDLERLTLLGYPSSDEPLAYPCVGQTCFPPVSRPEDLKVPGAQFR